MVKVNKFLIEFNNYKYPVETNMLGEHNIYNALSSFAVCHKLGLNESLLINSLKQITVPGRLESFDLPNKGMVVVDFAHTDDALRNVLKTAKNLFPKRLIALFGGGGDRDKSKRSAMGKVAAELSDYVIITSDNPRTEEPKFITSQIEHGLKSVNFTDYQIIIDRKKAIKCGIDMMQGDDILIIAGKGHEQYQIIGNQKNHFSDQEIVKQYKIK